MNKTMQCGGCQEGRFFSTAHWLSLHGTSAVDLGCMDALVAAAAAVDVSMDEDGDDEMELEDAQDAAADDNLSMPAIEVAGADKENEDGSPPAALEPPKS